MVLKNSSFSCYSCFRCSFFTITLKVRKMLACRAVSSITITPVSVDWRQSNRWMLRLSVNLFAWFSLESKREDWEPGTRVRLVLLFFMLCEKIFFSVRHPHSHTHTKCLMLENIDDLQWLCVDFLFTISVCLQPKSFCVALTHLSWCFLCRGNSKYHYYGIRIKPSSSLLTVNDDGSSNNGFVILLKTDVNVRTDTTNFCHLHAIWSFKCFDQ